MISGENRHQLEELVDTCSQGKDLTNVKTRSMLKILATCMLSLSNETKNKKDVQHIEEEFQKIHKSNITTLENRINSMKQELMTDYDMKLDNLS